MSSVDNKRIQSFSTLHILGGRIDAVTLDQTLAIIKYHILNKHFIQIITVNPLMLHEASKDHTLQDIFLNSGLVLPDSIGISIISFLKKFPIPHRIPGIDLIDILCAAAIKNNWSLYLYGSKPGVSELAGKKLCAKHPSLNILGTDHGYHDGNEEKKSLETIRNLKPDILLVGLKVPHQEKWIDQNREYFKGTCVIGIGGSFDVLSGLLKRAPKFIRVFGLEWFFRLMQEPWRWKRIIKIPIILLIAFISNYHISRKEILHQ